MKTKSKVTIHQGENGRFLPGNTASPGRKPNVPKDIRNHLISDINITFRQLIDVTEGKVLIVNGKEQQYNHFFWLECLKLRYAYVYGKPSIQVNIEDKRGMTDEEKLARSGNIDDLALTRAKDKLKIIEVDIQNNEK